MSQPYVLIDRFYRVSAPLFCRKVRIECSPFSLVNMNFILIRYFMRFICFQFLSLDKIGMDVNGLLPFRQTASRVLLNFFRRALMARMPGNTALDTFIFSACFFECFQRLPISTETLTIFAMISTFNFGHSIALTISYHIFL